MKKYLVTTVLACTALCSSAFAADGAINFTGKMIESACVLNPSLDVEMNDVAAVAFKNVGDESGASGFSLELKDCPAHLSSAKIRILGSLMPENADLIQLNPPRGVGLKISGPDGKTMPVTGERVEIKLVRGDNVLPFVATYKSVGKVIPGDVFGVIDINILYD
ncbi:type 1 fimbrial protein [Serratia marcescens]|uniref:fimbrial protein n=1 Tax=Serratia marcescens TaxID=615 RepID=UPI00140BA2AA|nr:fimbrial protein [Serratia marcescens]QIO29373.1 type 1 fimbrial protein [Serratia marcescens]